MIVDFLRPVRNRTACHTCPGLIAKTTNAGDLLAHIYSWFTEGFETADPKEAKALPDELG